MTIDVTPASRIRSWTPPQWYAGLSIAFFAVRAGTTLAAGASFALPGDGWRSVFQLTLAAVLLAGLARPRWTAGTVLGVGIVYTVLTVLELFHGADILGVIPVDMRDRIVHPLLAVLAFGCAALHRRATTRRARQAGVR